MTEEDPNKPESSTGETSIIARRWLVRIVIIVTVLVGYGLWSVYDAYVAYPARGIDFASHSEWVYLEKAIEADRNESPGILRRESAVSDPVTELARLRSVETRERLAQEAAGTTRAKRAEMELARERWLTALSRVNRLHPAYTNFHANPDISKMDRILELRASGEASLTPEQRSELEGLLAAVAPQSPRDRFTLLSNRWTTQSPPGPLQSYDIPVNKLSAVICFGFAVYLIYLFISVATKTYRWDPSAQRLTLPRGDSIVPSDLADVDKRRWDKFIVYLKIKDGHPKLGGAEIKFDTYRHGKIEEWILEMERTAFPERVAEEEAAAARAKELRRAPEASVTPAGEPA